MDTNGQEVYENMKLKSNTDPDRNRLCNLCYEWAIERLRKWIRGRKGSKKSLTGFRSKGRNIGKVLFKEISLTLD